MRCYQQLFSVYLLLILSGCFGNHVVRQPTPQTVPLLTLQQQTIIDQLCTQEINSRIKSLATPKTSALNINSIDISQAVIEFYKERNGIPLWSNITFYDQLLSALESTWFDGLEPQDYYLKQLQEQRFILTSNSLSAAAIQARSDLEFLATDAYLRALYHLYNGKVNPETLQPQWDFQLKELPQFSLLNDSTEGFLSTPNANFTPAQAFTLAHPQNATYENLCRWLTHYRSVATFGEWPKLALDRDLTRGMIDPQLTTLRQRFNINDSSGNTELFDEVLENAVKQFQYKHYLVMSGVIDAETRTALNISTQERIDKIRVNLDRMRWLYRNLPEQALLVDVAGFTITYFKSGQPVWQSLVQVGMPYRSTPTFRSAVDHITLNPTWTIPPTILHKDVLPKIRKNINYLSEKRIRIFDFQGKELSPFAIDWYKTDRIILRQDSGDNSALGKAAIRFPNPYFIYLHDTPYQALFSKPQRTFSSGCIRVERALELANLLLADIPNWNASKTLEALASKKTLNVSLTKKVPIIIAYWTIDASTAERISFRPDIYSRDNAALTALDRKLP